MKKEVLSVLLALTLMLGLTGCVVSEKEFSGAGITITLTNQFIEKEAVQAPLYLGSTQNIFMGMSESKSALASMGISTLNAYINGVLKNNNKTATVEGTDEYGVTYL